MKVFYGNGYWGGPRKGLPLQEIRVDKDFTWGKRKGKILSVFWGKEGIVLDLYFQIPPEEIRAFLEKWRDRENFGDLSEEEMQRLEAESPFDQQWKAEAIVDSCRLKTENSSSFGWNPTDQERNTALNAEEDGSEKQEILDHYGLDRNTGWSFTRINFKWESGCPRDKKQLSVTLKAAKQPFGAAHFTTEVPCGPMETEIIHPLTGQVFCLKVHSCEAKRSDLKELAGRRGEKWEYPECYAALTCSMTPTLPQEAFAIRDCAQSDAVKKGSSRMLSSSVFVIGGKRFGQEQAFLSALHFEEVKKVEWRVVFYEKTQEDLSLQIRLSGKEEKG